MDYLEEFSKRMWRRYFHMKNSKAFILSLWEDPGFVIIEAALCNLIVISSDCKKWT